MRTLAELEAMATRYADARTKLGEEVQLLQDEMEAARRAAMPRIRKLVGAAAEHQAQLKAGIEDSPDLFVRPKTLVVAGIKIGFVKQRGQIEFDDPEKVCALIEKHLPDLEETLIAIKRAPVKKALEQLTAADLKRIGVTVSNDREVVVIKPTDDQVDKLVTALLKETGAEAELEVTP